MGPVIWINAEVSVMLKTFKTRTKENKMAPQDEPTT
jgi:hypothetical protein